ncbi:MAG: hypothetical protein HUU16_15735 [Candidatus Omnitrophica bacterium]|nr:hypothetical protein [bacterium]NUN97615.1 hypothetical protein [Candidatus Omnitrophota bacterium]
MTDLQGVPIIVDEVHPEDDWEDLMEISESSFDFWYNPFDDEAWNAVTTKE